MRARRIGRRVAGPKGSTTAARPAAEPCSSLHVAIVCRYRNSPSMCPMHRSPSQPSRALMLRIRLRVHTTASCPVSTSHIGWVRPSDQCAATRSRQSVGLCHHMCSSMRPTGQSPSRTRRSTHHSRARSKFAMSRSLSSRTEHRPPFRASTCSSARCVSARRRRTRPNSPSTLSTPNSPPPPAPA